MTINKKVSNRLRTVASFISKGATFADIGSDHAFLPCYICLHDQTARAIAGEVNSGPYKSALETVQSYGLQDVVDVRQGNGLEVLLEDEIEELVIAGMGGTLIKNILNDGKPKLKKVKRIIAQPNMNEKSVRKWFHAFGYTITNEMIIRENGKIYEIIVGDRIDDSDYKKSLDEKELFFGPLLLKDRSSIFLEKWKSEHLKRKLIIQQIKNAKIKDNENINQFEKELGWIKEVLINEK